MHFHSLMKRSAFMSRRKAIIFIILTMLIMGVVSGFADPFISDGNIYKPTYGEVIVMEEAPPETGSPSDYDALSNLKYAAYKLHHASYFRGETDGVAVADIGFTEYSQYLKNTRVVKGENNVFTQTTSYSSLKSLGEQQFIEDGVIIIRPSTKITSDGATFADTAYPMSFDAYSDSYGSIPNQLSKYIINPDTILSVKDENAPETEQQQSSNILTSADDGVGFYVPEKLVRDANGNYSFTVELDPVKSTRYYRNEVRTRGGADQNPVFFYSYVTIVIDENWNPVTVTTVENYNIAIPFLGSMNCTGTNVETFYDLHDKNGVVPEREFFAPYLEAAKNNPDYTPPVPPVTSNSPADYLAAAFSDYISGAKTLDLTVDIENDYVPIYDLLLSVDIKDLAVQAMYGDLYIKYGGDNVYIRLNDINGYLPVAAFGELMKNDKIANLIGGLGDLANFDIASIFGDDILSTIFANCEMTTENGLTAIRMPFELDLSDTGLGIGKVKIDASIEVNDQTKELVGISGTVTIGDSNIVVSAKPLKRTPKFPSTDGAVDLSGMLDFIPDILAVLDKPTLEVSGTVDVMGTELGITAYIDRTDGFKVDATISVFGLDMSVKYVDGTMYVGIGNVTAKGAIADIPELISAILEIANLDTGSLGNALKLLIPSTPSGLIGMINSLEVTDTELALGLKLVSFPIDIELRRANGMLSGVSASLDINVLDKAISAAADLDISAPEARAVDVPSADECVAFDKITELVKNLAPYIAAKSYSVSANGSITANNTAYNLSADLRIDRAESGVALGGKLSALGQTLEFTYTNGEAFIAIGNIKVRLDTNDIGALTEPVKRIISALPTSALPSLGALDLNAIVNGVKTLVIDDNGRLTIGINIFGIAADITLDVQTGEAVICGGADGTTLDLSLTVAPSDRPYPINAPDDRADYIDAAKFGMALDTIADVMESKALAASAKLALGTSSINADIALSFDDGLKLVVDCKTPALKITYANGKIYIELGDVRLSGTLDDVKELISALGDVIPQNITQSINGIFGTTVNTTDITALLDKIITAITSLTDTDDTLAVAISLGGAALNITLPFDLGNIELGANIDGTAFALDINDISAQKTNITAPNGSFAEIKELIPAIKAIMPLTAASGLKLDVALEIYGVKTDGTIRIYFGGVSTPMQIQAALRIGDIDIAITLIGSKLYVSLGSSLYIAQDLTKAELQPVIDKLAPLFGGDSGAANGLTELISIFKSMTVKDAIACLATRPTENGLMLAFDTAKLGGDLAIALTVTNDNGVLKSITLQANATGVAIDKTFDVTVTDGVISSLDEAARQNDGAQTEAVAEISLGISEYGYFDAKIDTAKYVPLARLLDYTEPIKTLIASAKDAKSLAINIDASLLTPNNEHTTITGSVEISFAPIAVKATLKLFANTDAETLVQITFANGTLYIKANDVMLSLDTNNDFKTLYDILASYLPDYINTEIAKLLGLEQGASAFNDLSLIMDRITEVSKQTDISKILPMVFAPLGNLSGNSAVKAIIDMINLFDNNGELAVGVSVMGITINVTPALDGIGSPVIDGAKITADIDGYVLSMSTTSFTLSSDGSDIQPPIDGDAYVPIMTLIETVNNAINTFTVKDSDGAIAFEAQSFDFDYEIYKIETTVNEQGETVNVKDEQGRDKPATDQNGNKIIDKTIRITNKPGYPAIRGKFEPVTTTLADGTQKKSYKFNLEAHVVLDMPSALPNSSPLTLELYIINNEKYDGLVFLDYTEGNGFGERIRLDYDAIMEIVAAAMQIVGVDRSTVEMFVGSEHVQDVDTSVFDSMAINGLDSIKDILNNLALAINDVKAALGDVMSAWDMFYNAGSIEQLRNKLDGIKCALDNGINKLKAALARFDNKSDDIPETIDIEKDPDPEQPQTTEINGALFKNITEGVKLLCGHVTENGEATTDTFITAEVQNSLTTNTDGVAQITVTQSNAANKSVIDRISVDGLDVNTAKLNAFDLKFNTGIVEPISPVTLPSDFDSTVGNRTYSDMSNIKHLLFDVMNTANMLEFDIGGVNTSDKINIHLKLGFDWLANLDLTVKYNAKVKIIKTGEDENGKAIYKTAAAIEIYNQKTQLKILGIGSTVIVPECTTYLYFYDNMLYVSGVKSWATDVKVKKTNKIFGVQQYDKELAITEYVDVMYTVDELMYMISADMGKLLNEFLFYLIPITNESILGMNIRQTIIDQINGSSSGDTPAVNKELTIAQVFKGYSYDGGKHSLTLGLKELAGSSSLSDLNISLTGMNDGDDNIFDNYVSSVHIDTKLAGIITVELDATLRNVSTPVAYYDDKELTVPSKDNAATEYSRAELASTGLGTMTVDRTKTLFTYKNTKYAFKDGYTGSDLLIDNGNVEASDSDKIYDYTIEQIIANLLADLTFDENGKIASATNKPNGVQWSRPWQVA